jgi:methionyl-tRNA formyltransferase
MEGLRVVFMGSPAPVVPVLDALAEHARVQGWTLAGVYAAPERPAGRGRGMRPAPVAERAQALGIPVFTPARLRAEEEQARFRGLGADLVVLAAYGLLLPPLFLGPLAPGGPAHGALNVHPSLLPRWRGASPVASAILAGDAETGVCVMRMDEGLDTGPVLARERAPLDGSERTPQLTDRLFALGARLLVSSIGPYLSGGLVPEPQSEQGVVACGRWRKEDGLLEWAHPAAALERAVRAFDPWPGAYTAWRGQRLEVLEARVEPGSAEPGEVVALGAGVAVGTGEGLLVLERVKQEGKRALTAQEFLRGQRPFIGARLPS